MPQTRLTFFNHGDPEHIADPWVQDQATLGRLALAQREAARADAEARATLADRRYAQQRDMRDFAERQREFQARLGDAAQQRMEERAQADRLFEASQAQRAWQQQAEQRQEARLGEAMRLSNEDRDLARQDAMTSRRTAEERYRAENEARAAELEAARSERGQARMDMRLDRAMQEAGLFARRGAEREQDRMDKLADEERDDIRQKLRFEQQNQILGSRQQFEKGKLDEKHQIEAAQAESTRAQIRDAGMRDAAARFAEKARKIALKTDANEEEKYQALVAAAEEQLFPRADLATVGPDAKTRDAWAPTSREELEALQKYLMQAALAVFPQTKTFTPTPERARQVAREGFPGNLVGVGPLENKVLDTATDFSRWVADVLPGGFAFRAMGYPERTDPGLGARALGTAFTRNAGLFQRRSGR